MTGSGTAAPDPPVELAAFDAAIPLADVDAACRDAAAWNAEVLARPAPDRKASHRSAPFRLPLAPNEDPKRADL